MQHGEVMFVDVVDQFLQEGLVIDRDELALFQVFDQFARFLQIHE